MPQSSDVVVVGAGHNGLVAAAYLATAGKKVTVLERNPQRTAQLHELVKSVTVTLDPVAVAILDKASEIHPGEEPVRAPPPQPRKTTTD